MPRYRWGMSDTAPKVKICGITSLADAELAVELGAWAIGMIFYEASPRRCSVEEAQRITAALQRKVELCGVFVNDPLELVVKTSEDLGLTIVQLHGDEGPAFCGEVPRRTGARVIKAAQVAGPGDVRDLERYHVDFHLLDARAQDSEKQELRGGTGETFDWKLLARAALEGPADPERRPERGERRGGDRADAAVRGGQRERHRERSGEEGRGEAAGLLRGGGADGISHRRRIRHRRRRGVSAVEHRFGQYGGQFVPETLMPALAELEQAWEAGARGPGLPSRAGRPAARLRRQADAAVPSAEGCQSGPGRAIYLKREDLNHTGSHKLNNALGQALLAGGWASKGSSPRPAPASTAWRPRPCARCWGWSA